MRTHLKAVFSDDGDVVVVVVVVQDASSDEGGESAPVSTEAPEFVCPKYGFFPDRRNCQAYYQCDFKGGWDGASSMHYGPEQIRNTAKRAI